MQIELICGDALEEVVRLKDKSVDLILIDPPYCIEIDKEFVELARERIGQARVQIQYSGR